MKPNNEIRIASDATRNMSGYVKAGYSLIYSMKGYIQKKN